MANEMKKGDEITLVMKLRVETERDSDNEVHLRVISVNGIADLAPDTYLKDYSPGETMWLNEDSLVENGLHVPPLDVPLNDVDDVEKFLAS